MEAEYICDGCDGEFEIFDIAYLGPKNRSDNSCHPFMEFETLCHECEYHRDDNSEE